MNHSKTPPTSGGFYRFPKSSRLIDLRPLSRVGDNFPLPTKPIRLQELERNLDAVNSSSHPIPRSKTKTPARGTFHYTHHLEKLGNEEPQVLQASFSHHSCFLGVDNRRPEETQTETFTSTRKEFEDFKSYRAWGTENVDSLVKV
jgi:hypothetical protein